MEFQLLVWPGFPSKTNKSYGRSSMWQPPRMQLHVWGFQARGAVLAGLQLLAFLGEPIQVG